MDMKSLLAALVCAVAVTGGAAQTATLAQSVSGKELSDPQRLTAYEDSYAVWNQMRNNGWTSKDEQSLRTRLSFKYTFCGPQFRRTSRSDHNDTGASAEARADSWCPSAGKWAEAELFFGYAAEFDFYAGTRPSGPVIGRVNAPGLFVRLPARLFLDKNWKDADGLELGLQHRSNGQTGRWPASAMPGSRANSTRRATGSSSHGQPGSELPFDRRRQGIAQAACG